jgi:hypothetical protein
MASSNSGVANPDNGVRSPNPGFDADLATYIKNAKKYTQDKERKRKLVVEPEDYAAQKHLAFYSVDDSRFKAFSKDRYARVSMPDFISLLRRPGVGTIRLKEQDSKFWNLLCTMVLANKPKYKGLMAVFNHNPVERCVKNPEKVFRLSLIEHVYSFQASKAVAQMSELQPFSVSSSFGQNRSSGKSLSKSTSVRPLAPIFKIAEAFGIPLGSAGLDWGYSINNNSDRTTSENSSMWIATTLDFNIMQIEFPVLRSRRCLEVRPALPLNKTFFAEPGPNQNAGLYICDTMNTQAHDVNEIYSHVFVSSGESTMVDPNNPISQIVNNYLQGDREISAFFYGLGNSIRVSQNFSVQPFRYLEDATDYLDNIASADDGLIVHPLEYANEGAAPTFFNMFYLQYKERFFEYK